MIKTFRDAEIEVSKLLSEISNLRSSISSAQKNAGLTQAQVLALIKQNPNKFPGAQQPIPQIADYDSTADSGNILHKLDHLFLRTITSPYPVVSGGMLLRAYPNTVPAWSILLDAASPEDDIIIQHTSASLVNQILSYYHHDAGLADAWIGHYVDLIPYQDEEVNLGRAAKKFKKAFLTDLLVKANTPAIGDVLTASDTSGNVTWAAASSGTTNSQKEAIASSTLSLTTSVQDVPNATLSLDQDGVWMVMGCFVFNKAGTDTECQGDLSFDGTPQTGIVRLASASGTNMTVTSEKTWFVTVASQPKTAKLRALKVGTGTSSVDVTNSAIKAVYLHA